MDVGEYKINKSIEKTTEIEDLSESELKALQIVTDQFLLEEIADKLQNYLAILHSREVSLIEAKRRDRRVSIKDKIIIPIVTGIAGGILVLLFQVIFL